MVKVRLFPTLAQRSNSGQERYELPYQPGMTPADIIRREGFTGEDAEYIVVMVNNEQSDPDRALQDGDQVELLVSIQGG